MHRMFFPSLTEIAGSLDGRNSRKEIGTATIRAIRIENNIIFLFLFFNIQ